MGASELDAVDEIMTLELKLVELVRGKEALAKKINNKYGLCCDVC